MDEFKVGDRVLNTKTKARGHVVRDVYACCSPNEIPVVHDGETHFVGTDAGDLVVAISGKPVPDAIKCGAGREAECCIFLTAGPKGLCCERFTALRDVLIFKKMTAARHPAEPYPHCMKSWDSEIAS